MTLFEGVLEKETMQFAEEYPYRESPEWFFPMRVMGSLDLFVRTLRMVVALLMFFTGWGLWWYAMRVPAYWSPQFMSGYGAADTWWNVAWCAVVPFLGAVALLNPQSHLPPWFCVLALFCVAHDAAILGVWVPVIFRKGWRSMRFWRLLSFGLLLPWFYVQNDPRQIGSGVSTPVPGNGDVLWAAGSSLIALAVWVMPTALPGEPWMAVTALLRVLRGKPLLSYERLPKPDEALRRMIEARDPALLGRGSGFPVLAEGEGRRMRNVILILEDNGERVRRFVDAVSKTMPGMEVVAWRSAHSMVQDLKEYVGRAVLISLDHDLYAPGGEDVGDGLEVARFLAEQPVRCPVVIHSSNAERSCQMRGVLELEGWEVRMVVPVGERWVEEYWGEVVRGLVVGKVDR